jgi:hypothetical protein
MGKRRERVESDPGLTTETRRHWSADHARGMLAAWRRSGLSLAAFARRQGLNAERLRWWRKRLGTVEGKGATLAFIPAVVSAKISPVVVRLPRGVEVEAPDVTAVPARWLAEVVRALETEA